MTRRLGIDFDNTLIRYDEAFARAAAAAGWLAADVGWTKTRVRDELRRQPDGEEKWQKLQAEVYGPRIMDARPFDGVHDFLRGCRRRGWPVFVVSHKTEYANLGDRSVRLPDAARAWLNAQGLIDGPEPLIDPNNVYFEPTRAAKIARIRALDCTDFIDDLVEVFEEEGFPEGTRRWLFDRDAHPSGASAWTSYADWRALDRLMEGDLTAVAAALAGEKLLRMTPLGAGGNSRAAVVELASGVRRFLKRYPDDGRNRLGAETAALGFLQAHGFPVPQLVRADPASNAILLDWIEGEPVTGVGEAEIDAALDFARRLHAVREQGNDLPEAAEACFAPKDAPTQTRRRIDRLKGHAPDALMVRLAAALDMHVEAARVALPSLEASLAPALRTLSPSDFGLHNARRRPDGTLVWLDFEYFGWDDPVKLTADFMLHPGMGLARGAARRFARGAQAIYAEDPGFKLRLRAMLPLYEARWCTIMLNPFDPTHHARAVGEVDRARRVEAVTSRLARLEDARGYDELVD